MIKIRNISKQFGATTALASVSAEFRRGEVHCLLGENGAGKSTIGKILSGIYQPDSGAIEIDGKVQTINGPRVAHQLGVAICHQELSLAKHLSVRANLCLGAEHIRHPFALVDRKREEEDARRVLTMLGLDVDLECAVGELPVAQQQLIEIGKALMLKPKAVIFDEPTAMLGAVEKQSFLRVLRQLRDEGLTVILVTHHIDDVMTAGDHITIMRNGRVVDTFALEPSMTAEVVVERLTGKKRAHVPVSTEDRSARKEAVLTLEDVPFRGQAPKSVTLQRGQIVSLYGVVGCGAEKIVAAVTGQASPDRLRLRLLDKPFRPKSLTRALEAGIAYLPSGRAANCILPGMSIAENLTLTTLRKFGRLGFLSKTSEARYAVATLQGAGVKFSNAALPITSLSGGNQQKVLLARAMACARELLVLEEPTAGVDIDAKAQIHARIVAAAKSGLTVLLVSSDLEETISLSDVVLTMYKSEIAGVYDAPSIADQPNIIADVLGQCSRDAGTRLHYHEALV